MVASPIQSRRGPLTVEALESMVPLAEAVLVADATFSVHTASDAAARLLGWNAPSELVRAVTDAGWHVFEPEQAEKVRESLERTGQWLGAAVLTRQDGSHVQAVLSASSLHDSDGTMTEVLIAVGPSEASGPADEAPPEDESFELDGLPGRFFLLYEPAFDLRDGSIPRCNALLKWWHPDYGVVDPKPALADTKWADDLASLRNWPLHVALDHAAAWRREDQPVVVSLELSRELMDDPDLLVRLRQALGQPAADPANLAVEISLGTLVKDPIRVREVAEVLHQMDVRLIIDGVSGDAPPEAFEGIAVHALRIEAGSIGRPSVIGQHRSVDGAIGMAHALGALGVARSVSSPADLHAVLELGFDQASGRMFGPPLSYSVVLPTLKLRNGSIASAEHGSRSTAGDAGVQP